jgi:membrane protein
MAAMPGGGVEIVTEQLKRVSAQSNSSLSLAYFLGLVIALWSANAGVKAIFDALNVVYEEEEKRSFLRLNLISLAFTIGAILFVLLALAAVVVLPLALDFVGFKSFTGTILTYARWPVVLVAVAFVIALFYRFGPSRTHPRWRWVSTGSVAAAILWLGGSLLFSWYVANFGSYNKTYGSLGAAIGFMTWIWISAIIVLAGAELNSEIEHQTAHDTTVGPDRPIGQRGATMADTIGATQ